MELAGADHNIEANIWPGGVAGHTGRAHVVTVCHLVFHPLQDSHFTGRGVVVVDWVARAAADAAVRRTS